MTWLAGAILMWGAIMLWRRTFHRSPLPPIDRPQLLVHGGALTDPTRLRRIRS